MNTARSNRNLLVLAVDDDQDDLELFCEATKTINPSIDIITAPNGEEALLYLRKDVIVLPDFIFMDINMPRMDGRACLKEIMADKYLKRIPVFMLSTSLSEQDKNLFATLGASFLTKASTFSDHVISLRKIFKDRLDEIITEKLFR